MADVFTRGDLQYTGYKHTAHPGDDPRVTGKPDSTYLNRNESYEMAPFINRYMISKGWSLKSSGHKIETFLKVSTAGKQSHAEWKKELDDKFNL
jgi:hypothetical protein